MRIQVINLKRKGHLWHCLRHFHDTHKNSHQITNKLPRDARLLARSQWSKINNPVRKFSYFRIFFKTYFNNKFSNLMQPKKNQIFFRRLPYRMQKHLGFLQHFSNEIHNFGSLWRHGVTQRHRFEKSHKWALLSRHEQLRKTCKQINKDHQDSFTNIGNFFKYKKQNNNSFSGFFFHILSLCCTTYGDLQY